MLFITVDSLDQEQTQDPLKNTYRRKSEYKEGQIAQGTADCLHDQYNFVPSGHRYWSLVFKTRHVPPQPLLSLNK